MEIKDFITVIENGEEIIKEHLNNGKVVFVKRIEDEIVQIDTFDSEEDFIKDYIESQEKEEYDYQVFKTAEEAYLLACNIAVSDYFEDGNYDLWSNTRGIKGEQESNDSFRKAFKTYEELTKDINKDDFVDGFYEWNKLEFPYIKGENFDYEYVTHFCKDDDIFNSIEGKAKVQLYVK